VVPPGGPGPAGRQREGGRRFSTGRVSPAPISRDRPEQRPAVSDRAGLIGCGAPRRRRHLRCGDPRHQSDDSRDRPEQRPAVSHRAGLIGCGAPRRRRRSAVRRRPAVFHRQGVTGADQQGPPRAAAGRVASSRPDRLWCPPAAPALPAGSAKAAGGFPQAGCHRRRSAGTAPSSGRPCRIEQA
jgi:hypothetical protein